MRARHLRRFPSRTSLRTVRQRQARTVVRGNRLLPRRRIVVGGLDSHHAWVVALANATGRTVVAVDYRLAPEHPFPAAAAGVIAGRLPP
ncbi:alpha/beta hydrolase fold domain-containing protein [Streptomyces lavendulae]|uniref:alpha/beta hydrolase fold domain-containing protein n=1 Tax=Streptomyces lavendulae TaxID=1914 RepID=UPI0033FD6A87